MKIYSLTPNHISQNRHLASQPAQKQSAQITSVGNNNLDGVPKSYISFGMSISIGEEVRKIEIAQYLEYLDKAKDLERGEEYYKERVQDRINELINERSHYGSITGNWKTGKVKKVERLRIEQEEYAKYLKEKDKYKFIKENEEYFKGLVSTEDIQVYEKVKQKLEERSSLDKKIAGYKVLKNTVKKLIIDPIHKETALDTQEKLPPALLLYGPIGCGKSALANAIVEEANCNVIKFPQNTNPRKFAGIIKEMMNDAKDYYLEQKAVINKKYQNDAFKYGDIDRKASYLANLKSPRTIIIIDEVDQYFNPNTKGSSEEIADINKTLLKGLLDHCSEKPSILNSSDAAGVTFIFTTNYPSFIDSEISLRGGKCNRAPVPLPEDSDIKDIMKFYIMNSANPSINKAKTQGKNVTPIDTQQMPYDSYLKFLQPTEEAGAFSGGGIESAINQAVINYIDDPEISMNIHLARMLSRGTFRIPMEKLAAYNKEMEKMGRLLKDIDEKEEYELLKDLQELDMINPKQKYRLELLKGAYEQQVK